MLFWDIIRCNLALYILGIYQVLENIIENLTSLFHCHPWQKRKIPNLAGKVALVTGANRGIGKQIAIELTQCGCHVILACRNRVEALQVSTQDICLGQSSIVDVDLSRFDSVSACAQQLKGHNIDYVVCNAGIMAPRDFIRTVDGYELQMQVNCLSSILLVHTLLRQGSIHNSSGSRIAFLSSFASSGASIISFQDVIESLTCKSIPYHPKVQYANTKLLDIMVASDLQKSIQTLYSNTATVFAINPGVVDTELARNFCRNEFPGWMRNYTDAVLNLLFDLTLRRPKNAARGLLEALIMSTDDIGGRYVSIRPFGRVMAKASVRSAIFNEEGIFRQLIRKIE